MMSMMRTRMMTLEKESKNVINITSIVICDNLIVVMKPTLSPRQLLIERAKKTVEYYL